MTRSVNLLNNITLNPWGPIWNALLKGRKLIRKIGNYSNGSWRVLCLETTKPTEILPIIKIQSSISSQFQREFPHRHKVTPVLSLLLLLSTSSPYKERFFQERNIYNFARTIKHFYFRFLNLCNYLCIFSWSQQHLSQKETDLCTQSPLSPLDDSYFKLVIYVSVWEAHFSRCSIYADRPISIKFIKVIELT